MVDRAAAIVLDWVNQEQRDTQTWAHLFASVQSVLDETKPKTPVRLYRNERRNDETQYDRFSSWTADPAMAADYPAGGGRDRQVVSAMIAPKDIVCFVPALGPRVDWLNQQEMIVRPGRYHRTLMVTEAQETIGAALREGRDAPLYHGTHLAAALEILKNDTIEARSSHETSRIAALGGQPSLGQTTEAIQGVSLTRSRDQALHFEFGEIVFELDQRKLSQTHKLIPFDYWSAGHLNEPSGRGHHLPHTDKNEAEEFCVGAIKPASRYITAIYMSRRRYGYNTKHYPQEVLRPLLDHPLLRII